MPVAFPQITLAEARRMAAAVADSSAAQGVGLSVAIVDAGGCLLLFERDDDATPASATIARAKAECAAAFRLPTEVLAKGVKHDPALAALPGVIAYGGGMPIVVEGRIAGAIGVSGGMPDQDVAAAAAAIAAIAAIVG